MVKSKFAADPRNFIGSSRNLPLKESFCKSAVNDDDLTIVDKLFGRRLNCKLKK